MKINHVIDAFNKALQKIMTGDKCYPVFVSTVSIEKKIGTVKECTIRIFLVDQVVQYRAVILKKTFTCSCLEKDIETLTEHVSLEVIADLALLFSKYKDDLIVGNYEPIVNLENGNKQ